jgi:hypothetical protein
LEEVMVAFNWRMPTELKRCTECRDHGEAGPSLNIGLRLVGWKDGMIFFLASYFKIIVQQTFCMESMLDDESLRLLEIV